MNLAFLGVQLEALKKSYAECCGVIFSFAKIGHFANSRHIPLSPLGVMHSVANPAIIFSFKNDLN